MGMDLPLSFLVAKAGMNSRRRDNSEDCINLEDCGGRLRRLYSGH